MIDFDISVIARPTCIRMSAEVKLYSQHHCHDIPIGTYLKKKILLAPIFYHARLRVQTPNGHSLEHYDLIWFSTYFAHRR